MKKVKVKFPDGSIGEIDEKDLPAALQSGAVRYTESAGTKKQVKFADGSLADLDEADIEGALTAGATLVKKKVAAPNGSEIPIVELNPSELGTPSTVNNPLSFKGRNVKGQQLANFKNDPNWKPAPEPVKTVGSKAAVKDPFALPDNISFTPEILDSQEREELAQRKSTVPVPSLPNDTAIIKDIVASRQNDAVMRERAKKFLVKDAANMDVQVDAENFPKVEEYFNEKKIASQTEMQNLMVDMEELGSQWGENLYLNPEAQKKMKRIAELDTYINELKKYSNVFVREQATKEIKLSDYPNYSDYLKAVGRKVNAVDNYEGVKKKEQSVLNGSEDLRSKEIRDKEDFNFELAGIETLQANILNDLNEGKIDETAASGEMAKLYISNQTLEARYPEAAVDNLRKYLGDYIAQKRKDKDGVLKQTWENVVSAAPSSQEIITAIHDLRANDGVEITDEQEKALAKDPDKIPLTSMLGHIYKSTILKGAQTLNSLVGIDNEDRKLDFRDPALYQPVQPGEIPMPVAVGEKNIVRMQPNPKAGEHADILSWATANTVSDVAGTIASYLGLNKVFGVVAGKVFGEIAGAETVGMTVNAAGELKPITALTAAQTNLASNVLSSTYLNYYDKLEASKDLTDDPIGQKAYALSSSIITGLVFAEINPGKILSGVTGAEEKEMGQKFIEKLMQGKGKLEPEKYKAFFSEWAVNTAKDLGHNLSLVKANQIADIALDKLTNKDALKDRDVMDEVFGSLPADVISFLPFSTVVGYKQAKANVGIRNAIRMALTDPVRFETDMLKNVETGKISPEDAAQKMSYVKGLLKEYRGADMNTEKLLSLTPAQRFDYANNLLKENAIKFKMKDMTDELQIAAEREKITALQEQRKILLNETQQQPAAATQPISAENKAAESTDATAQQTQAAAATKNKATKDEVVDVPIAEIIGGIGTYKGIKGDFEREGQRLIFNEENGVRSHDIGNINEIKDKKTSELGIEYTPSKVEVTGDGVLSINGETFVARSEDNPLSTIKKDAEGNITSIVVREEKTGAKKMFKGSIAEDIAYQLHLKDITKDNETAARFEEHINTPEVAQVINEGLSEIAKEETTGDNGKVQPAEGTKVEPASEFAEIRTSAAEVKLPVYKQVFEKGTDVEIKEALKDVSDQWHDEGTRKQAERDFGETIVNEAKKLYPQESKSSLNIDAAPAAKPISERIKKRFEKIKKKEPEPVVEPVKEAAPVEVKEEVKEPVEMKEASPGVFNVPIADISTNETEYQGRKNKFSERSAKNVAENFDANKLDPIIVYKHPDGKTYVLSGHSRFEGMSRRGEKTIPARFFEGTPAEAKDFALKSNKLGTLQTDIENAAYYREKLKAGESYNALLSEAKENEQEGSAKKIVSLAHLNPSGKAMQALESLEKGEGDTKNNILNIAQKIGDIRSKNDHLTDAHENELFDYMVSDKDNIPTDKDIVNQNNTLNRSINAAKFTPEEPLNLERLVVKSENRIQWEKEKKDLEQEQSELKKLVNPSKATGWTGLKEKAIATLTKGDNTPEVIDRAAEDFEQNKDGIKDAYQKQLDQKKAELNSVNDKLAKHLLREKDLIEGDKNQQSLFAIKEKADADLQQMKDIVRDIQNEYAEKDEPITLDDIKAIAKTELGDEYNDQLVEEAYHEAGKESRAFKRATAIQNELAKRVEEFTGSTTEVLPNSEALLAKAEELQGDVKYQKSLRDYVNIVLTSITLSSTPIEAGKERVPIGTEINKNESKNESQNKQAISKLLNSYFAENNETVPQEVIDRAFKVWERTGKPDILPDSTNKNERAFASKENNSIGNITNFDDLVAELSHAAQFVSKAKLDERGYATQAQYDKIEYDRPGSVEYDAHKIIEPLIASYILNGQKPDIAVDKYGIKDILYQVAGKTVTPMKGGEAVVNGFYSPLEKAIGEIKADKLPAKQWAEKFKGEEAKWTGLTDWLNSQTGTVSKAEIQQYLKDNRIEVVEVVKSDETADEAHQKLQAASARATERMNAISRELGGMDRPPFITGKNGGSQEEFNLSWHYKDRKTNKNVEVPEKYHEELDKLQEDITALDDFESDADSGMGGTGIETQYSTYQLPGEKSNYKELLITLPKHNAPKIEAASKKLNAAEDALTESMVPLSNKAQEIYGKKYHELDRNEKLEVQYNLTKPEMAAWDKAIDKLQEAKMEFNNASGQSFQSRHFDEPNIVAHVRMNVREVPKFSESEMADISKRIMNAVGAKTVESLGSGAPDAAIKKGVVTEEEAKAFAKARNFKSGIDQTGATTKVLFLEEIQSDWGELGRKEGFSDKFTPESIKIIGTPSETAQFEFEIGGIKDKGRLNDGESIQQWKERTAQSYAENKMGIPAGPFVTDTNAWTKLALKAAAKEAVKVGADKIAWTNGEQQGDRYSLRKQVNEIRVDQVPPHKTDRDYFKQVEIFPMGEYSTTLLYVNKEGIVQEGPSSLYGKPLKDVVGKEMAEKIMNSKPGFSQFTGLDLEVGGEGMKAFYGEPGKNKLGIVGNVAKSLFKQEPKTIQLNASEKATGGTGWENTNFVKEDTANFPTQHSVDITPEMRSQVEAGQPLFMKSPEGEILGFTHEGKIYLNGERLNPNTIVHEAGHIWVEVAKKTMPAVYNRGRELIKGSMYLRKALENKFYQAEANKLPKDQRRAYYEHEALAAAIGDKGAQFITEARRKSFIDWAKDLWNRVAQVAGFKNITGKELQDMTLDEFAKRAAGDILKGKEPVAAAEPATSEPVKPIKAREGEGVLVSYSGMQKLAEEFGYEDVRPGAHKSDQQLAEEAATLAKSWNKEGTYANNVDNLVTNILNGKGVNDVEKIVLQQHIANIRAEAKKMNIFSKEYDEKVKELERLKMAGRQLKEVAARVLRDTTVFSDADPTMADWMAERKEVLEVDELTNGQKEEIQNIWNEYETNLKTSDEKLSQANQEIERLAAELAVKTEREKRTYLRSKNKEALKTERENIVKNIKDKIAAAREKASNNTPDTKGISGRTYVDDLFLIAPDVSKLVTNLIDTGIIKLADIIDNIHGALVEDIPEITKRDVHNLIAGNFNKEKPTLTALQYAKKEIVEQAKLINKLEKLQNGEPVGPERQQRKRIQEITDLRNKIKEYRKYDQSSRTPEQILNAIKKRYETQQKEIERRIAEKDFSTKPPKPRFDGNAALKQANPKLWKETMDALNNKDEAGHKFEILKRKDELEKRGPLKKYLVDPIGKAITTAKAIKAGIDDSVTMVQLMMAVYSNPKAGFKAKIEAFQDVNNTRFKRQLAALHNSVYWDLIQKSELDITEPQSFGKKEVEELYSGNLLDDNFKIPFTDKKVNPWTYTGGIFERIFTSMGNNLRLNLFYGRIAMLEGQGKTFESHPEEYKGAARAINELTGRGKVADKLQTSMDAISPIIWAPKMLASTFNTLGITDVAAAFRGKKGVYRDIPPQQARYLGWQMAKGISMGAAVMGALALRGWGVDLDPRSNTFGNVASPDGNRKYNVFGRFGGLVKNLVQFAGGVKVTSSGQEIDIDKSLGGRGKTAWTFVRGKMTPATGIASDYVMNNKTNWFTKQPINLGSLRKDLIDPISFSALSQGLHNDGTMGLLNRFLPELEGIQVSDNRDYKTIASSLPEKATKFLKDHNLPEPYFNPKQIEIKQMKNGKGEIKKLSDLDEETQVKYEKTHSQIFDQELSKLKNSFVFQDEYGTISLNSDNPKDKKVWVKNLEGDGMKKFISIIKGKATEKTKELLFKEYKK